MGLTQHQQRGRHHPGDRQPAAAARQHRQARRRRSARSAATPTCRATAPWASGRRRPTPSSTRSRDEFGFEPPREHGLDTVDTIRAMRDGEVKVFFALGGNFVAATPDTARDRGRDARARPDRARLDQAQPLARRSPAREALILPTLGRTERDLQAAGEQFVTVEDSMGMVHASRGPPRPGVAAPALRGRDRHRGWPTRCSGADGTGRLGRASRTTTTRSATTSRGSIPGFERLQRAGRASPAASRCRTRRATAATFPTTTGKARFTVNDARASSRVPAGHLLLQTHPLATTSSTPPSTASTTATAASSSGRRVVFVQPRRPGRRSASPTARCVDLVSEWPATASAGADGFRVVAYPTARGLRGGVLPRDQRAGRRSTRSPRSPTPRSRRASWSASSTGRSM